MSNHGFTGEWTDYYIKLQYLRSRWYSPYLNQFIQADPIVSDPRIPADWNRNTYARDNPIKFIDPTGKWVCTLESYAYNRDCADWVKDALAQLKNSSHIGPKIVDFFDRRDKELTGLSPK